MATQNSRFPQGYMTKVEMQLESKVETIKHKPSVLKKVTVYITFITKMIYYIYIFMCLCWVLVAAHKIFVLA